jgi:N-methylhydantoinase A
LSFDVGGTSADVAVIHGGAPAFGVGEMVGEFPIYVPTVSVTSIGEGGGSIAWVDDFGVLKVGPESAGSTPGPACYARGGLRPTITDAFAVLGLLGAGELGYGAVTLDTSAARTAVQTLATPLGLSLEETAESIIRVSISGMYLEISKLMSRHGADPRTFSLLAFGGAGPMTACLLARDLGFAQVIVPLTPGVLSAYGGLISDIRNDFIRTAFVDLDATGLEILDVYAADMEAQALRWLREEQGFEGEARLVWTADMRYRGQSYEIETLINRADVSAAALAPIGSAFHREHERVYGHADLEAPVQIVNLRLVISGSAPKPAFIESPTVDTSPTPTGMPEVYLDGATQNAAIFARADLAPGHAFSGPAIITQDDCTTIVPPGQQVDVDVWGNLIIQARFNKAEA